MITVWLSIFCHLDRYLFHVQLNQVLHKWRRYVWYKLYITSVYLKKIKFYKFWGFYAAILVHRWLPGSRKKKKWVHLWLQGVALATGIFGIWTKFQGTEGEACSYNCSCHYASHSCSRSSKVYVYNKSGEPTFKRPRLQTPSLLLSFKIMILPMASQLILLTSSFIRKPWMAAASSS
ncbi:putative cytochrome b561/Cytochrome b reductase 1 [Helianthus annuus]|nr:putative cytochrome b561/Cytochrome b reductase 1 [Helianthus annuus]